VRGRRRPHRLTDINAARRRRADSGRRVGRRCTARRRSPS